MKTFRDNYIYLYMYVSTLIGKLCPCILLLTLQPSDVFFFLYMYEGHL